MNFIPVASPDLSGNERRYVLDCIDTGWISSLGKYIPEFEEKFAKFCDAKFGVAVCNGTAALQLALLAIGVKPGDEIIIPDLTFVATANACTYLGAKPVPVDCHPYTWTIDPQKIEEKITKKTKAIIPVHLYGHPCDMDPILEIAKKHNLKVVEDAAEAHGARYKGRKVGSLGDVGCFSFYGNKIITSGEGGMCTTNSQELERRMRFLKDHGMDKDKRYWHPEVGFNFRITNIQAAIALAQIERVSQILESKRKIAKLYKDSLKHVKGITFQPQAQWAETVYWLHSLVLDADFRTSRDQLMAELKENNIDSRPFFYPIHELPPFVSSDDFKVATLLSRSGLNLPSSNNLTEEDIKRVSAVIIGKKE